MVVWPGELCIPAPVRVNDARPQQSRFRSALQRLGLYSGALVLALTPIPFFFGLVLMQELALPALQSGVSIVILIGLIMLIPGLGLTAGALIAVSTVLISARATNQLPRMLGVTLLFMVLGYGGVYLSDLVQSELEMQALRDSAEQGDAEAQLALARSNMEKVETVGELPPDCVEAIDLLQAAAYQDNAEAQFELAMAYDQCSPTGVRIPIHAWLQIAAHNPTVSEAILHQIGFYYQQHGRGLPVRDFLRTERVVEHVLELFKDPDLEPETRRAAIAALTDPLVDEAINQKILWSSMVVNDPVSVPRGMPVGHVLATPETAELGITENNTEVLGIATLPLDTDFAHLPVVGEVADGAVVGVIVYDKDIDDLPVRSRQVFVASQLVELDDYPPHTVVYVPNLSAPEGSRSSRPWYRTTDARWKRVPDAPSGRTFWNRTWAEKMESDEVPAGNPLLPDS